MFRLVVVKIDPGNPVKEVERLREKRTVFHHYYLVMKHPNETPDLLRQEQIFTTVMQTL